MFRKAALLVASLVLVIGCAKEADEGAVEVKTGDAAVSALRAAPDAAADAGTARFEVTMSVTMQGEPIELVATGAYDAEAQQMSMSMDMGAMLEQLASSSGEELPAGLGDGVMEMVADGDAFYIRSPLLDMMSGSTGWLSVSAEELGAGAQSFGAGASAYDPTKLLESLRGVVGEPEVVGQEEIDGVETTHYRATMDLAKALEQVPEQQRAEVEASLEQLGNAGEAVLPVDIWIDGDDLPRRMTMDMGAMLGAISGESGDATITMEFFDYGEPVDIEIPPADEVTPLSETLGGVGGFGAGS